jgi:hypothetical protein
VHVDALKNQVINKINLNVVCDWKNSKHPYTPDYDLAAKTPFTDDGGKQMHL